MTITGAGSITATTLAAQNNLFSQLEQLSQQLGTGQASQTYAGLGSQAGVAVSLSAQLSAINSYATTGTALGTTLTLSQSVLTQIGSSSTAVQQAISQQGQFSLDNTGQTATQKTAASYLDQIVSLLNTQAGNGYIFSGSATDQQSVAATGVILNGSGSQAGLVQVISQRQQADEGTNGLGRLTVGGSGSTVTLASDGSPFGFQLSGVSSGLTGATATGPAGIPPTISVALGSNPNPGDFVAFNLTMPDGTSSDSHPDGNNRVAAGRRPVHNRFVCRSNRFQSAVGLDGLAHHARADGAAGLVGDRCGQQLLLVGPAAAGQRPAL